MSGPQWLRRSADSADPEDSRRREHQDRPRVSVVIPAYNAAAYIGECLSSLLGQTCAAAEIIVVDDCSTDDTWSVVMGFADKNECIRAVRCQSNSGEAAARNLGFEHAVGDYIMCQDADDMSEPARVERLWACLDSTVFDFVSSGYYLFDQKRYKTVVPRFQQPTRFNFLYGSPFCHAATMFRRECLAAAGGYRVAPETKRGADYDLFMRLYSLGFRGVNLPDILYGYRVDHEALSRRTFARRLDECVIRWKGFAQLGLLPWGAAFVLKPLIAHVVQRVRERWNHA